MGPKVFPKPRSFTPVIYSRQAGSHTVAKEDSIAGLSPQPAHPKLASVVYGRPGTDLPTSQMATSHRKGLGLWPVMDQGMGWPTELDIFSLDLQLCSSLSYHTQYIELASDLRGRLLS